MLCFNGGSADSPLPWQGPWTDGMSMPSTAHILRGGLGDLWHLLPSPGRGPEDIELVTNWLQLLQWDLYRKSINVLISVSKKILMLLSLPLTSCTYRFVTLSVVTFFRKLTMTTFQFLSAHSLTTMPHKPIIVKCPFLNVQSLTPSINLHWTSKQIQSLSVSFWSIILIHKTQSYGSHCKYQLLKYKPSTVTHQVPGVEVKIRMMPAFKLTTTCQPHHCQILRMT